MRARPAQRLRVKVRDAVTTSPPVGVKLALLVTRRSRADLRSCRPRCVSLILIWAARAAVKVMVAAATSTGLAFLLRLAPLGRKYQASVSRPAARGGNANAYT